MHRQVVIKVNAEVDAGVAPLVEALNHLPGVVTVDSCERAFEDGMAYVYFIAGNNWRELGELVERLAAALRTLNLCCGFSVALEWIGSNDQPRALLRVQGEHVEKVAATISGLAS